MNEIVADVVTEVSTQTSVIALVTALFLQLIGGWTEGLTVLCVFIVIDLILGLLDGLVNKSSKSKSGGISSLAMFKGIIKKITELTIVVVGAQLDRVIGSTFIRDGVVIAYIITEVISIIENAAALGVITPEPINKAIDVLKHKDDNKNN